MLIDKNLEYNLIGIDPSLISTAMCINGTIINYCRESDAYNKTGLAKWFKLAEQFIEYKFIEYRKYKNYSEGELIKLFDYDKITDSIILDIKNRISNNLPTKVAIEGYSYSSDTSSIIDLVTFSTLLRKKIVDEITDNIKVIAPSTLKQESCKLTYEPINIGKKKEKLEYRNNDGVAGGKFTKREIYLSIIENKNIDDLYYRHLKEVCGDILEVTKIPKPYEDSNDAYVIYQLLRHGNI